MLKMPGKEHEVCPLKNVITYHPLSSPHPYFDWEFQNYTHGSAPSCDHLGHYGEWKKYLATKILAKVANWRPTDLKRNLLEKLSKIQCRTNLINSKSDGITCLSLFPSHHSES